MNTREHSLYAHGLAVVRRVFSAVRMLVILSLVLVAVSARDSGEPWVWKLLLGAWFVLGASFFVSPDVEHAFAAWWTRRRRRADGSLDSSASATDRRALQDPTRFPDREAYLVVTLLAVLLAGLRGVLSSVDGAGFGVVDAPAIAAVVVSAPSLVALGFAFIPKVLRAWGAKEKDTGEGSGAASTGQAAVTRAQLEGDALVARAEREGEAAIVRARLEGEAGVVRAEKEGEAALLLARAELRRADAEHLRAEKGLDPLPPAQLPAPDQLPALPPANGNGSAPAGTPQLPSA
ncbi:hypothetical protein AB0Q95_43690 [Streptomyces sp. NPDC059900]|uniref:hypothetical protein n=1 Tax=Streptomyces sp. NPDC059900 TaxID=3155816 RepID=UPI00342A5D90